MISNDNKKVYDLVYTNIKSYNSSGQTLHQKKQPLILDFVKKCNGKRGLDVGSGAGYWLQFLIDCGNDMLGVEISEVCCKRYLSELPHVCSDIVDFKTEKEFDFVICMDVLEHIEECNLDATIEKIATFATRALFGIANHNDIVKIGTDTFQLHPIQRGLIWWEDKLREYYSQVNLLQSPVSNFYMVETVR